MNLIIDAGNTRIKIYKISENRISAPVFFTYNNQENIIHFINHENFSNSIIANVGNPDLQFLSFLKQKSHHFIKFDQFTNIPLKNEYKTPESLGYDRLAAAIGASNIFKNQPILIIDIGTAITFDIVSDNKYWGGAIAPGLKMRFQALHQFTERLPMVNYIENFESPGKNTNESILNGCVNGIKNEILGTISAYQKEYSGLKVVITGGNADIFVKMIKNSIFVEPYLTAKGLNRILNYNVEKN